MSRDDIDELLDDGLKAAVRFLEANQEFFPFGVTKTKAGDIRHVNLWQENQRPKSDEVIDLLRATLRARAKRNEIVCGAIISDVKLKDPSDGTETDAIRADIDHESGSSITCYLPYRLVGSQVETGKVLGQPGTTSIFANG